MCNTPIFLPDKALNEVSLACALVKSIALMPFSFSIEEILLTSSKVAILMSSNEPLVLLLP